MTKKINKIKELKEEVNDWFCLEDYNHCNHYYYWYINLACRTTISKLLTDYRTTIDDKRVRYFVWEYFLEERKRYLQEDVVKQYQEINHTLAAKPKIISPMSIDELKRRYDFYVKFLKLSNKQPTSMLSDHIVIDLNQPKYLLVKAFEEYLEDISSHQKSNALNYMKEQIKGIGDKDIERWEKYKVLEYIDLYLWQKKEGRIITNATLAEILDIDDVSVFEKYTKKLAVRVLSDDILYSLQNSLPNISKRDHHKRSLYCDDYLRSLLKELNLV